MADFNYKAKKGPKEIIEGVINAETKEQAIDRIAKMGYVPVSVLESSNSASTGRSSSSGKPRGDLKRLRFFKKVSSREITIFTEQLASLIKSKVPLLEAISILLDQAQNPSLKDIISDIYNEIKDGANLSQALNKHPKVFPRFYTNMVNSGEEGGVLEETLIRLADFRNKEEDVKSKVVSALAYPAFITLVGVATVFVLVAFVIPKLGSLFEDMGDQSLPLPTKILIDLGDIVQRYWLWAIILIVIAIIIVKKKGVTNAQRLTWEKFKLRLPLVGDFLKKSIWARFSLTLAILLDNGLPLFQAIEITRPTLNSEIFNLELEKIHKDIIDGSSLQQSMKKSPWFSSFMSSMLTVGERGGNLKDALLEVASFYEREIDKITKVMTSLLEPVIILVMGLVVGFIVFAMLLPIFQMNMGM